MLSLFVASTVNIQYIGGGTVKFQGNGKRYLSLLPDSGKDSHVTEMDNAVYIPSYTFNTIQPQILVTNLNIKYNLDVDYSKHDYTY